MGTMGVKSGYFGAEKKGLKKSKKTLEASNCKAFRNRPKKDKLYKLYKLYISGAGPP